MVNASATKPKQKGSELDRSSLEENVEELYNSDEEGGTTVDGIYIPPPVKPVCSFDPHGPRLIITKIENSFFKSYAENEILGPFTKCFNAIVGPNGSGKSNVIDSILFVFGYRAAKIRCKKVSVLLHNSEKYRNVQSCTVSVHFALITDKEGKEYEIIPGSEFVVSRTAFKDNSSYYTLNNKRVQFKDVAVVLKKYGIDLDYNRFLILQGEVEQIAMMKCKAENEHETGMLEYLEDIIGTTRYKKPIDALNERVEQLAEVRNARLNRARLAENELEALKEPMEQAVEFLQKENTVIRCKNFLYQKEICELEETSSKVEEERKTVSDAQKELLEKLAELAEKKEAKDKILKEENQKFDKITKERDALKEAFNKANTKDVELKENMMQTNATRKKTKDLLKEEKERLIKLEKVPAESEKSVEECKRKEESLLKQKEKLDEEKAVLVDNIRKETQPLQDEKEALQTKLVDLKKAVDETKSAFTLAESEYNLYVKNEETERAKYENLKDVFENNKKTIQERTEALKDLEKKIPTTSKALNDAQKELEQVRGEEANLSQEFRGKSNYLQEIRNAMQASRSSNRVLESLMHQKRNGKCDGLFGRLGDLGAIDKKFDVAVSTACGPLDNIVVDNVDTAKWCINFLKQNNIGVATFIALDKQEHLRQYAESSIKTPENVHRLYDLIRVQDERVRTAFYYALRDTLVANDLEQATRIAYGAKRYRVVTLNGELIETTGTMSGGGRSVRRGRMGQSVAVTNTDPREIQQMEGEVQRMEKRIRELRQRQQELEEQINVMMPQLRQMKIDQEKFTMELNALRQQQPQLEVQVKQQLAKSKATQADPKAAGKLKAVVEERKQAFEKASSTAGKLQEKVDKLTKELNEKSIMRIKAMDKNIKTVVASIEKVRAEITRLKVAVTTAERNAKKSEEKIAAMEQDIVDMEEKMRAMRQEREEIEEDGKKLIACIEQHENTLKEGENKFGDLKQEVKVLTEKEKKLKTENVDVTEKLKTLDKQIHVHKAQMQQWRHKIKGLELQEVPDATVEPLKTYTKEEIEETDVDGIVKQLKAAEDLIKLAKPNLNAIQEYRKKQKVFIERTRELEEVTEKRNEMRALFDKLRDQRKLEFTEGYNIIRMKLKEMYQMITLEGDADFELVDSFDPFTEGIQFNVRPPKKSWKNISNLSGGEKTLSSLALVFAVHYYKPSPLYIMDEIDAALDFKNVSIIGNYIKERTKNAQFIIISLRSNMFELCDNLIGIYKTYNCTHSLTIDPCGFEEELRNPHENNNMRAEKAINADEDKENHVGNDAAMETDEETMANRSLIDHDYISPNTSMNLSGVNGKASDLPSEVEDSFVENMDVDP